MKNPKLEAVKEIARLGLIFSFAQLLTYAILVPESWEVIIIGLPLTIPLRQLIVIGLTAFGRFFDKKKFVETKLDNRVETRGYIPF